MSPWAAHVVREPGEVEESDARGAGGTGAYLPADALRVPDDAAGMAPVRVPAMKRVPCKGCGRMIVWGVADGGKTRIPLDPSAPVYLKAGESADGAIVVAREPLAYASHFATCPAASRFSGQNRGALG